MTTTTKPRVQSTPKCSKAPRQPPPGASLCPNRQAVHGALSKWLDRPDEQWLVRNLHQALTDFELRTRLLRVLPPSTT
jgi:hypothetical protein